MLTEDQELAELIQKLEALNPKQDSDSRIEKILGELHAECRAFRDTEFKVMSGYLSILGFIFAANTVLISRSSELCATNFHSILGASSVFICILAYLVINRLHHDHLIYDQLFMRIRAIRRFWNFRGFFPTSQKGNESPILAGKGSGWKQNRNLVLVTAVFVNLVIGFNFIYAPVSNTCG